MRKISKVMYIFTILMIVLSFYNFTRATDLSTMIDQANSFVQKGEEEAGTDINYEDAVSPVVAIGSILTTIGVVVMLGATSYMGIKYLVSGPDARAKLKQQLIGLIVSGVVIFGAYYIWRAVVNMGQQLT